MNKPLVKIGIPTYNRPKGLYNTLAWLQVQPYKNIEVYISDNCSPNNQIGFLLDTFCNADKRFKYQVLPLHTPNVHANFDAVYKFAGASPYFVYMADDDKYSDNFLEACVSFLEANRKYSLCAATVITINNKPINFVVPNLNCNSKFPTIRMLQYLLRFKRSCGMAYGMFRNTSGHYGFDPVPGGEYLFAARLALAGNIRNIADTIMWRSATGVSSSMNSTFRHQISCAWWLSKPLPLRYFLFVFFSCKFIVGAVKYRMKNKKNKEINV